MNTPELNSATIEEVAEACARSMGPRADRKRKSEVRAAVRAILGRVADQPGGTWQQRWVAAGDDNEAYFRTQFTYFAPNDPALGKVRRYLPSGFQRLLVLGVIRPGLLLTLHPGAAAAILGGVIQQHQQEVDRLVTALMDSTQITEATERRVRNAAAAMIVFTGKPLSAITVDEWVAAETQRREASAAYREWEAKVEAAPAGSPAPPQPANAAPFSKLLSLNAAYTGARLAGLVQPRAEEPGRNPLPPTLDGALRPAQDLPNVLAAYGRHLPPSVHALVYDVYTLDGAALDNSTVRAHISIMDVYFRSVHKVLPGHDSLNIPLSARDAILRHLSMTLSTDDGQPSQERQSLGRLLFRVRSFYRMADSAVHRFELTQHLPALGSFPWSQATVRQIARKDRARTSSQLHAKVRAHLPHLDGLVEAAKHLVESTDRILYAARATPPGERFVVDGVEYVRAKKLRPHVGNGVSVLNIRRADASKWAWFDIERTAHRAMQSQALTVLLRETGLRIEEVAELQVENVDMIMAGDMPVPALAVNPSKMDRGRVVVLTAAALRALHDLIVRTRERFGSSPLVTRFDWHERTDQPPARLIFFTISRHAYVGPDRSTFAKLLTDVVKHYNEHFNPTVPLPNVTPHQVRRLFATDLAERGADPLSMQKVLGHASLATTGIYLHMDEAAAMANIIEVRRRARENAVARDSGHEGYAGDSKGQPE